MGPILDESSLMPCPAQRPGERILGLAQTLRAFDELGARRLLRSVRDAADRDVHDGDGLRRWCFDHGTNKDAGRLVAGRLARQPFIDGEGGLFAVAEGDSAVEARVNGDLLLGCGLAALTDGVVTAIPSAARSEGGSLTVELTFLDEDGQRNETAVVPLFVSSDEVMLQREELLRRIDVAVADGQALLERQGELFPRILLGQRAIDQIALLNGREQWFKQVLRHLRALDIAALHWATGEVFEPQGITYSVESMATLEHGDFGPMRDFPVPAGFTAERWTLHTKLTGGAGARIYFRPERIATGNAVLIGYVGAHLQTVRYRT